jgi:4'-phosphopantetheinyl transferase
MQTEGQWSVESTRQLGEYPGDGCIDVWLCSFGATHDVLQEYLESFDVPEKARAASFRTESAWSTFVARRAMVRAVSSRYLGVPSDAFVWETGSLGKPLLRTEAGQDGLEFSWSQAGTAVVVGVALGIGIGVDACRESDGERLDGLEDIFCSQDEASALTCMPWPERSRALVQCWTAKEACLKAAGTGLLCDPRRLRTWGSGEPLERVEWKEGPDGPTEQHMTVAYRTEAGGITLAVAAPVALALTVHRLIWKEGDDDGLE